MFIFGKLIGGLFGFLIAGPVGLILGLFAGHYFDKGLSLNVYSKGNAAIAQNVFFKTTFMIMGYIAKADGRVSENEIQMARSVMAYLQLTPDQKIMAIDYYNQGKSANFNSEAILDNFVRTCGTHPQLVQMFIEIQLQAAFVDGLENQSKRHALERLCDKLRIPRAILSQIESQFYAQQHFEQPFAGTRSTRRYSVQDELQNAYNLLGVSASSTDQELKKAYRVLMSQNHPDKLVAKGLPEEMIKVATEKTQKIQKAYEMICQSRGI